MDSICLATVQKSRRVDVSEIIPTDARNSQALTRLGSDGSVEFSDPGLHPCSGLL